MNQSKVLFATLIFSVAILTTGLSAFGQAASGSDQSFALALLDEHEPSGAQAGELAAELRADRPTGAGHQYPPAGDLVGDGRHVEVDGLFAEHGLPGARRGLERRAVR